MVTSSEPPAVIWDYDRAETVADGVVHAIGISLGLAGAIAILIVAANSNRAVDLLSVAIYATSLVSMLALSAAYNLWPISPIKWALRRFDHSAIYMMIGGTYTPFIAQLQSGFVSAGLLVGVWSTAAVGVALKLLHPDRFNRTAIVLYLLLGWSGAAVYEPIAAALPISSIWLLAAGGVLYTTGVVFHLWRSLRFHNAIWHGFRSARCVLPLFGCLRLPGIRAGMKRAASSLAHFACGSRGLSPPRSSRWHQARSRRPSGLRVC
jgi:hemolysin III